LGELIDAVVTATGEVVVLDGSHGMLRVYDRSGGALLTVGQPGEGPGEFEDPVAVANGPGDTILVADRMAMIHRFVRGPNEWAFIDRISTNEVQPEDVCSLDGRIFVYGKRYAVDETSEDGLPSFAGTIHEIDSDGSVVRSFGWVRFMSSRRTGPSSASQDWQILNTKPMK
jgi:hypothetical protein